MTVLGIIDTLNDWIKPVKEWIYENHNNPFLWIGLVLIGLAVFAITYSALHRD